MHAAKWFNILALLQVGFAQDLDVGYLKILQDGLINVGTMQQGGIPGANLLSFIGPLLQQNQDLIINYASDTLTESLDEASRNYTSALCLNHTELFIKALFRRENWALRSMYQSFHVSFCIFY
jgi:hypothetical protein